MTFKEAKKVINGQYYISFDWDIFCDIAERCGFDPTDDICLNHWRDHETYMEDCVGVDIWHECISISDPDWETIEQFSDRDFLKEYFFDNYTVDKIENVSDYGLTIYLVHA